MRVCILGNSLSSLTLARALVNQKIYVDIVNSKNFRKSNQTRTIGISKTNIEFFNESIININKIIWKLKKIQIYSDNLKNEQILNFENNNDQLFSIVKNHELYDLLKKRLKNNALFKKVIFKNNSKFFEKYDIVFNTDPLSSINKKYFNKQILKTYSSFSYTTVIDHEKILNDTAVQIFTQKGPLAFLPISNKETSVVFSINSSKKEKDKNIIKLINFYNFKYKIYKFGQIDSFELKSLNMRSYYFKKFLAFGDLLHRIHPLAGQGFNMTIRDIKIILEIIKNKQNLGLPLDYFINKEFEEKMRHKNFIFANGIDLVHEFFNLERKIKGNVLSKSLKLLGNNSRINKIFTNIADKGSLL